MQLQAYLTSKGLSEKQFADQIGASESGVLKWVRRERIPRPEKMREISRITDGAVTAADFFELPSNSHLPPPADDEAAPAADPVAREASDVRRTA